MFKKHLLFVVYWNRRKIYIKNIVKGPDLLKYLKGIALHSGCYRTHINKYFYKVLIKIYVNMEHLKKEN